MAYPVTADLTAYLSACGITLTAAQTTQAALEITAAIQLFERLVGRKMEAAAGDTDRFFNPPDNNDGIIFFREDLASLTSVTYIPVCSGSSQVLVQHVDYKIEPINAIAKGKPYRFMRMGTNQFFTPINMAYQGSYKVTGRWGFATTIPQSAFNAIVQLAAATLLRTVSVASGTGVKKKRIEDYEVEYGIGGLYSSEISAWADYVSTVVKSYRIPI